MSPEDMCKLAVPQTSVKIWPVKTDSKEFALDWQNRTTKSKQDQNARRKRDLLILWTLGGWHHQTSGNERQNSKRISQEK